MLFVVNFPRHFNDLVQIIFFAVLSNFHEIFTALGSCIGLLIIVNSILIRIAIYFVRLIKVYRAKVSLCVENKRL